MTNNYYNNDNPPVNATKSNANNESTDRDALEAAFDMLPEEAELKSGQVNFQATDSGVADAYVVSIPYITSLTAGQKIGFIPANDNTGASTINVSGLGAVSIKSPSNEALVEGEIVAGRYTELGYTGTEWQMLDTRILASTTATKATQGDAETGTDNDRFMTPLRNQQHYEFHRASQAEAEAGADNDKYLTSLRNQQHFDSNRASQAEAEAGTNNVKFTTPLRVSQRINSLFSAANTILLATTSGAPSALQVTASTLFGRKASGNAGVLTPAEVRALLNVADGADVTNASSVDAAGGVMNSDTSTAAMSFVLDEDDMASDSDEALSTQQAIAAFVNAVPRLYLDSLSSTSGGSGAAKSYTVPTTEIEGVVIAFRDLTSSSATGEVRMYLGDSGGLEATGYGTVRAEIANSVSPTITTPFNEIELTPTGNGPWHGVVVMMRGLLHVQNDRNWVGVAISCEAGGTISVGVFQKELSGDLETISIDLNSGTWNGVGEILWFPIAKGA